NKLCTNNNPQNPCENYKHIYGPRNGRTYIMYHGTSWWAALKIMAKGFCPSKCGMLEQGVYLTWRRLKTWHDEGYDSAWVPPNCGMVKSGLDENCVWDPNRITLSLSSIYVFIHYTVYY
uniref:Uncharacterized protein n=1 Tax=Hucho hucho TaxID=62062 RepID=A0A4W5JUA0_9TELE